MVGHKTSATKENEEIDDNDELSKEEEKIKTFYEQDFNDLMLHLKEKYPKELFDLDGIGKQLDLSKFSKDFFGKSIKTTSDISVDQNSNVDDVSVISYTNELKKPFERINSYYMLWKECRTLYGLETANKAVELNLAGDIYINDIKSSFLEFQHCCSLSNLT